MLKKVLQKHDLASVKGFEFKKLIFLIWVGSKLEQHFFLHKFLRLDAIEVSLTNYFVYRIQPLHCATLLFSFATVDTSAKGTFVAWHY